MLVKTTKYQSSYILIFNVSIMTTTLKLDSSQFSGIVIRLWAGQLMNHGLIPSRDMKNPLFSNTSRLDLGLLSPLFSWSWRIGGCFHKCSVATV